MGRLLVKGKVAREEADNRITRHRKESRPQQIELAQEMQRLTDIPVARGIICR
jgi:hypothetical protein